MRDPRIDPQPGDLIQTGADRWCVWQVDEFYVYYCDGRSLQRSTRSDWREYSRADKVIALNGHRFDGNGDMYEDMDVFCEAAVTT